MRIPESRTMAPVLGAVAVAVVMLGWTSRASAYAWMIRRDYTSCAVCHADPSGGGLLTAYGRAQGEVLLRTRYGADPEEEPGRVAGFLLGAFELPEELLLGDDVRGMLLGTSVDGSPVDGRAMLMQADLGAELHVGRFRANGTLGLATDGALGATVVGGEEARLVSRTHWIGVDLGADRNFLLRAGRINMPFGVRLIEHTAWVRTATRSDINTAQQHGVSLAYTGESWRGELMAILGNYQVRPDDYRERGYSFFVEHAPNTHVAIGVSSMIAHADADPTTLSPTWRHAHGAFARWSPERWLVVTAEGDFVLYSTPSHNAYGVASFLQADFEPTQGLHLMSTFELQDRDVDAMGPSLGAWGSVAWFFAPHADFRLDGVFQDMVIQGTSLSALSILAQLHVFL